MICLQVTITYTEKKDGHRRDEYKFINPPCSVKITHAQSHQDSSKLQQQRVKSFGTPNPSKPSSKTEESKEYFNNQAWVWLRRNLKPHTQIGIILDRKNEIKMGMVKKKLP